MPGHQKTTQDPFHAPKYVKAGQELKAMWEASQCPALNWPVDLFDQAVSIERPMADEDTPPKIPKGVGNKPEDFCQCGCGQKHNNNCQRVVDMYATTGTKSWRSLWYYSRAHKDAHVARGG